MSATRSNSTEAGFSLVEILCVLVILGLSAGLVVLNLPKGPDAFEDATAKFTAQLNLAARDSVIDGRTRGLNITASGYELFNYDTDWNSAGTTQWDAVDRVKLTVDGEVVDLKAASRLADDAPARPIILFEPTGGVTPFTLSLQGKDGGVSLSPDRRGRIIGTPE